MEYMFVFFEPETPHPELMSDMGEFAGKLAAQGKMRGGAPLHSSAEGARV